MFRSGIRNILGQLPYAEVRPNCFLSCDIAQVSLRYPLVRGYHTSSLQSRERVSHTNSPKAAYRLIWGYCWDSLAVARTMRPLNSPSIPHFTGKLGHKKAEHHEKMKAWLHGLQLCWPATQKKAQNPQWRKTGQKLRTHRAAIRHLQWERE